ncbi:hypothetical protein CTA2_6856 [Colletotrichum tanaceti]|uniref:Zn(2)-C6 fungal-type domain-containing protein n=1 Tax=Colletotrichum tanaceti TaxID=1306861 RepID=A0A4U6X4V6_9PEZI|nr:hypothetical protein CTA2_6856 [Colletotrichum tanaceti]TKW50428.1 hypothetical protein CTA1_120 [Colletotrichum tanaceti]
MDAEPSSVASSWAGSAAGKSAYRKERGHIAQRACEVCRRRKQKCDEEKPTCGYCLKAQLECDYGSPKPTNIPASLPIEYSGGSSSSSDRASSTAILQHSRRLGPTSQHQAARRYASAANKIMAWPAVRQTLENVRPKIPGLQAIFQRPDFSSVLLEQRGDARRLPRGGVESMASQDRIALGIAPDGPSPVQMTTISPHILEDHARIYFNTFNRIHPVLDRQHFMGVVFPRVLMNNFDEDASSTLLCLVLALAEVAIADVSGRGFLSFQDQPREPDDTTERTEHRPPGIEFFNEARRRLGFSMGGYSLENVQMYILTGLYYESCSQHTESWKMTISASLACHALIAKYELQQDSLTARLTGTYSSHTELNAAHGDQICRAFWYCSIAETSLQLELQLPLTGLDKLEPSIQMPQFPEYITTTDQLLRAQMYNDRMSHYGEIFVYQISLRNLSVKVYDGLEQGELSHPRQPVT